MKVRILAENLTDAVIEAGRAIAKRSSLPSAQCVLLETVDGRLRVTGTDLETAISVYAGAQVLEEGKALIPAAMMGRMLNTFTGTANGALTLTPDGEHGLSLVSDGRTFKLTGQDPADYPPTPETPEHVADIDPLALRLALTRILDCVATDTVRPRLQTVNFAARDDGTLRLAAADGLRLGVHKVDTDGMADPFPDMNVPAKTMRELLRLLPENGKDPDAGDPVRIYTGTHKNRSTPIHVRFALKRQDVTTALVQDSFPNYSQLIPKDWTTQVQVGTKALQRELAAAAAVLATQGSGIVRYRLGPGDQLTIMARAEEEGEFEATLPAKVATRAESEGKIAFNYRLVADFLKTVGTEAVELQITSPSSPSVFRPVGDDSYLQVMMPMFVQW